MERKRKEKDTFLVQPIDGEYIEFTWERVGNEARKVCSYINSFNFPKKSKIAILSKNCAHWIITDLAIMMSGNISVPIYANVNGKTAKYILEHSESVNFYLWENLKKVIGMILKIISQRKLKKLILGIII